MLEPFERRTLTFVVRVWLEPMHQQGEPRWRGQIEHIGSGETAYFKAESGIAEFLAAHIWQMTQHEQLIEGRSFGDGPGGENDDK